MQHPVEDDAGLPEVGLAQLRPERIGPGRLRRLDGPQAGWTTGRVARAWAELMRRLGYERYGAQGGDWGAFVSPELGRIDPDHVVGVHVNAATMGFIPFGPVDPKGRLAPVVRPDAGERSQATAAATSAAVPALAPRGRSSGRRAATRSSARC